MGKVSSSPGPLPTGPDFVCIGAMKAGTTWLHDNLGRHRRVWMLPVKEINYLNLRFGAEHGGPPAPDRVQARARKGLAGGKAGGPPGRERRAVAARGDMLRLPIDDAWYARLLAHRRPGELTGDVSPGYALLPAEGVAHAAAMNPRMKVVALLRDPADRAFSHIAMHARDELSERRLMAIIEGDRWPLYAAHSDYAGWLGRWAAVFGRDAIHVDTLERIRDRHAEVLAWLCAFLDIPEDERVGSRAAKPVMASGADLGGLRRRLRPVLRAKLSAQYAALARSWPDLASLYPD